MDAEPQVSTSAPHLPWLEKVAAVNTVTMAALGLRAVQLYHHASQKAQADAAVARARACLEARTPRDTEERVYQSSE